MAHQARYEQITQKVANVPWYFVGLVHSMECDLSFEHHLHNGDSLKAPTRYEPANRPPGRGPFTFEESAIDALRFDRVHLWQDWSVAGMLFQLEGFDGWGYRMYHAGVLSPYLWSGSQHYASGKYVGDGEWIATAGSKQTGAEVLLQRLCSQKMIALRAVAVDLDGTLSLRT